MRQPHADSPDPYAEFTRVHLGAAIAIVGTVIADPALVLDVASEAIAAAYGDAASPHAGGLGRDTTPKAVLDAVERVVNVVLADELVPRRARLRLGEPQPTTLDNRTRAAIMRLCRAPLPRGSRAEQVADILRRNVPSAAVVRRIRGSGLVGAEAPSDRDRAMEPGT